MTLIRMSFGFECFLVLHKFLYFLRERVLKFIVDISSILDVVDDSQLANLQAISTGNFLLILFDVS